MADDPKLALFVKARRWLPPALRLVGRLMRWRVLPKGIGVWLSGKLLRCGMKVSISKHEKPVPGSAPPRN